MLVHLIAMVTCKTPVNTVKPDETLGVSDYPARKYPVWCFRVKSFFQMIKKPLIKSDVSRL